MVAVAQLVESRIVIPVVVGSSPIGHPSKINDLARLSSWAFSFLALSSFCVPAVYPDLGNGSMLTANGQLGDVIG